MFNNAFFSETLTVYEIMWMKYGRCRQVTDENITRRMRFPFWIIKARESQTKIKLITFCHGNNVLRTRLSVTFICTLPPLLYCLVIYVYLYQTDSSFQVFYKLVKNFVSCFCDACPTSLFSFSLTGNKFGEHSKELWKFHVTYFVVGCHNCHVFFLMWWSYWLQ
jgi:hypothetical protein